MELPFVRYLFCSGSAWLCSRLCRPEVADMPRARSSTFRGNVCAVDATASKRGRGSTTRKQIFGRCCTKQLSREQGLLSDSADSPISSLAREAVVEAKNGALRSAGRPVILVEILCCSS